MSKNNPEEYFWFKTLIEVKDKMEERRLLWKNSGASALSPPRAISKKVIKCILIRQDVKFSHLSNVKNDARDLIKFFETIGLGATRHSQMPNKFKFHMIRVRDIFPELETDFDESTAAYNIAAILIDNEIWCTTNEIIIKRSMKEKFSDIVKIFSWKQK